MIDYPMPGVMCSTVSASAVPSSGNGLGACLGLSSQICVLGLDSVSLPQSTSSSSILRRSERVDDLFGVAISNALNNGEVYCSPMASMR